MKKVSPKKMSATWEEIKSSNYYMLDRCGGIHIMIDDASQLKKEE